MPRRYYESEPVLVTQLQPGDEVVARRTITTIVRSSVQAVVTFDDGTTQTFDLTQDPTIEAVTAGLR